MNRYVHGARVALEPFEADPGSAQYPVARVLDFNVHPKRCNDPVPYPDDRCQLVNGEGRIEPGKIFAKAVVSRLPYAISSRGDLTHHSGFMLDQERLIGLNVSSLE